MSDSLKTPVSHALASKADGVGDVSRAELDEIAAADRRESPSVETKQWLAKQNPALETRTDAIRNRPTRERRARWMAWW